MKSINTFDLTSHSYGIGYDSLGREFYFDIEDFNKIKEYYWRVRSSRYVTTSIWKPLQKRIEEISLHRFLLDFLDGLEIDHINLCRYDNRKENLRVVTTSQNQMNVGIRKNNNSGVSGVNWDSATNKWRARICINNRRISLDVYDDINDAIEARKQAEEKYFGEWSYDNSQERSV